MLHYDYFSKYKPTQNQGTKHENDHDISLIIVNKPFDLTEYVRPICLPQNKDFQVQHVRYRVTATFFSPFRLQLDLRNFGHLTF